MGKDGSLEELSEDVATQGDAYMSSTLLSSILIDLTTSPRIISSLLYLTASNRRHGTKDRSRLRRPPRLRLYPESD